MRLLTQIHQPTTYIKDVVNSFTPPAAMPSHGTMGVRRAQLPVGDGRRERIKVAGSSQQRGVTTMNKAAARKLAASPRQKQHLPKCCTTKHTHRGVRPHPFYGKESTECRVGGWRSNMNVL